MLGICWAMLAPSWGKLGQVGGMLELCWPKLAPLGAILGAKKAKISQQKLKMMPNPARIFNDPALWRTVVVAWRLKN